MEKSNILALAEQLNNNQAISFVPTGNSMWPTLKSKGQAVVVQKKTGRLKEFDVALYYSDDKLILHRVLRVQEDGYITCGDSQLVCESVPEQSVIGVMTGFYENKKFVDANDVKQVERIKKWYSNPKKRKAKIKMFFFFERVKGKLKRIFSKK